jgi:hypothetical protein
MGFCVVTGGTLIQLGGQCEGPCGPHATLARIRPDETMKRIIWVLGLLLVGCGGAGMTDYKPVTEKTKFDEEALLSASASALEARGYVASTDHDASSVTTREKEISVSSVPKLSYKYTWEVTTKGGTLTIKSTCTQNSSMKRTKFEDCGDERPERLIQEAKALKTDILKRAKGDSSVAP